MSEHLRLPRWVAAVALGAVLSAVHAYAQLSGEVLAHDPSTVLYEDGRYYYFGTGDLLDARSSSNLTNWTAEPSPLGAIPSWIPNVVTDGSSTYSGESLWAPDVIKLGDTYHLYYSASIWGTKLSAIGHASSPTLDPDDPSYGWTDHGMILSSTHSSPYNAIDPSMMLDEDTGRLWMTWGSFNNGIYVLEMDPTTGAKLGAGIGTNVAAPVETHEIEGAAMMQRDGSYYLFTNWGGCCSGVDSTYNLRVGRSDSPTGPFLDRDGRNMLVDGGTLLLDDDGRKIGPGHFSFFEADGQDKFSYHYYDGARDGFPTFGIRDLYWTADGWPKLAEVDSHSAGLGDSWGDATGWDDGVPDAPGHIATFAANATRGRHVSLGRGSATAGVINFRGTAPFAIGSADGGPSVVLDNTDGEEATINVASGSHLFNARVNAQDRFGVNVTPADSRLSLMGGFTAPELHKYGAGVLEVGDTSSTSGGVYVRNGVVELTGTLTTNGFSSLGQIVGEEGELRVAGDGVFNSRGDLNVGDSGSNNTAAEGTLVVSDTATVDIQQGGLYVGSGFFNGSRAVGLVTQTGGTVRVASTSAGSLTIAGRNSSNTTGTYDLSGGSVEANGRVYVGGRGDGDLTVRGTGEFNANGGLTIANNSSASGVVTLTGGMLATSNLVGGAGDSTLWLNGGIVRPTQSSSQFLRFVDNAYVAAGGAHFDTDGHTVTVSQDLAADPTPLAVLDGGLTKTGFGTLRLTGDNTYRGPTHVFGGVLEVMNETGSATGLGKVDVFDGATLTGQGALSGNATIRDGAVLAPGAQGGELTISGGLTLRDGSTLAIDIGSTVPGLGHDVLHLGAPFSIEPTALVEVSLFGGFDPQLGDTFDIVEFDAINGAFAGVVAPGLDPTLAFDVDYRSDGLSLVVVEAGLPGDYNLDGRVDAADYTVWRDTSAGPNPVGSYAEWSANYGSESGSSTAVPEPTAALLLASLLVGIGLRKMPG